MTIDVQIAVRQDVPEAGFPAAADLAGWAQEARGDDTRALCLRVVGESEGIELNARFRDRRQPTNVLAFPAEEPGMLGDIAICAPVAALEARALQKPLPDHYAHLVVHGVLHLLGLDHDTPGNATAMETREAQVLERFGIDDPYGEHP